MGYRSGEKRPDKHHGKGEHGDQLTRFGHGNAQIPGEPGQDAENDEFGGQHRERRHREDQNAGACTGICCPRQGRRVGMHERILQNRKMEQEGILE
ncbi:hypothetical protein D3C76_1173770 [compost metagenome]